MSNRAYQERESARDWQLANLPSQTGELAGSALAGGALSFTSTAPGSGAELTSPLGGFALSVGRAGEDTLSNATSPAQSIHLDSSVLTDLENQMREFSVRQAENFKRLRKEYVLIQRTETEDFLRRYRSLIEILLDAVPHLRAQFGPEVTLNLRLGLEEGIPQCIYATIPWKGDIASARAALEKFDDLWWLDNVRKASGRVVFDYELA